jgi:hypothetical protein
MKIVLLCLLVLLLVLLLNNNRELFYCNTPLCNKQRRMNQCFNCNTGPYYDDRLTNKCMENFATIPGQAYGGVNESFLQMLNQHNLNMEGFKTDDYSYIYMDDAKKDVQPVDTENTAMMGEHLNTEDNKKEHLRMKNPNDNRVLYFDEEPSGISESGPLGYDFA